MANKNIYKVYKVFIGLVVNNKCKDGKIYEIWLFIFLYHSSSVFFLVSFFHFYHMQNMWLYWFWTSTATLNSCSWKHIYYFNVVIVDINIPLHFADYNNFRRQGFPRMLHHRWGKKMVLVTLHWVRL